jgi:diguanylate cyclase (GGDEF)-like protein
VARIQAGDGVEGGTRDRSAAGHLAREVSALQASLLGKLQREMPGADVSEFAGAAQRLAEAFGSVTAAAVDPVAAARPEAPAEEPAPTAEEPKPAAPPAPPAAQPKPPAPSAPPAAEPAPPAAPIPPPGEHASLYRPGQMRRRLDQLIESYRRYDHPFCLVVFDVHGPAAHNGHGPAAQAALTIVGAALRDSIRLVDETFPLEEEALCVLAPNQNTVGGVQMSERLLGRLEDLEAAGGLPIGISAGVAACPEHGGEAEGLLQKADEAMWRARAVGQPVGVGRLEPLQDR